jgi:hypothetical protein
VLTASFASEEMVAGQLLPLINVVVAHHHHVHHHHVAKKAKAPMPSLPYKVAAHD